MFSHEDICEVMADEISRGKRTSDGLSMMKYQWGGPKDLGDKFLEADESTREEMRRMPLPKSVQETPFYLPKKQGVLTFDDAMYIRRVVPKVISGRECAKRLGVSHITVQRIVSNKTYRTDRTRLGPAEIRIAKAREIRKSQESI